MNPYFSTINYPQPKDTMMVMLLPDFQVARSTRDFATGMVMAEYGITSRWTAGFMAEGQKINGLPVTFGGVRVNTYVRVFQRDHLLNFTLYGEYEHLNQAALYKMEVSGFGGEDLSGPLAVARRTPAHTFEQRAIVYHDWGRLNATFNFISETDLESSENNFGYAWGIFRQPAWPAMSMDNSSPDAMTFSNGAMNMSGAPAISTPPALSRQRLGYGIEMMGALGNTSQFGFDWPRQQQYLGPAFSYAISPRLSIQVEPTFGLSGVSDPFVFRVGVAYSINRVAHRIAQVF